MKKTVLLIVIVVSFFSCKAKQQTTDSSQKTSFSFISDLSKVFTQNQKDSLNLKISQFEQETTNEIAIFTLDSISGDVVFNATILANSIGVGKKDKDNGLLILLVKPMREVGIATGKGTMQILTDSICQNIIDQQMIPEFKKNNFYEGMDNALNEIIKHWTRE